MHPGRHVFTKCELTILLSIWRMFCFQSLSTGIQNTKHHALQLKHVVMREQEQILITFVRLLS